MHLDVDHFLDLKKTKQFHNFFFPFCGRWFNFLNLERVSFSYGYCLQLLRCSSVSPPRWAAANAAFPQLRAKLENVGSPAKLPQ